MHRGPKSGLDMSLEAPEHVRRPPPHAQRTDSGLAYRVLQHSEADVEVRPGPADTVEVHYAGWTREGELFDSTLRRGHPSRFALNQVIRGWSEGLQLMAVGQRNRFWIPGPLAYGDTPRQGRPAGMLVFDIALLAVAPAIDESPPDDLNSPPSSATRTSSLLIYNVLREGTGSHPPGPQDQIKVHYSGWTSDGTLFDSTRQRGRPAILDVDKMIPGWSEAMQLMVKGQRNRLWIPSHLAYGSRPSIPGAPSGMLVIDVELVDIGRVRGVR